MQTITIKNNYYTIDKSSNEPLLIINHIDKKECLKQFKIVVKKGIKASLIDLYLNEKESANQHYERVIELEENASLEYIKYQDINTFLNLDFTLKLKESSTLNMTNFELGQGINNNNYISDLDDKNVSLQMNALVKLYEESNSTSQIITTHNAKSCLSSINYKHSLHDQSKATFQAKTIVNNKALYSKAYQNSNTILLSDDATIFAQPHLEILIDELEASHGATTGSLNSDELLYLQSRGISKNQAYEMLLKAFENEIYDSINNSKIIEFLKKFKRSNYV